MQEVTKPGGGGRASSLRARTRRGRRRGASWRGSWRRSLGWDIVIAQAQAQGGTAAAVGERPAADPDFRFAVVQSEPFRRHLRSAVADLDPVSLARYLSHFARWYAAAERSPRVATISRAVLDESVRGLGLEAA